MSSPGTATRSGNLAYVAVPRLLLDALLTAGLNEAEFKVAMCIARYTYSYYKRRVTRLSCRQMAEKTKLHPRRVQRALRSLITRGFVEECAPAAGRRPRTVRLRDGLCVALPQAIPHGARSCDTQASHKEDSQRRATASPETPSRTSSYTYIHPLDACTIAAIGYDPFEQDEKARAKAQSPGSNPKASSLSDP